MRAIFSLLLLMGGTGLNEAHLFHSFIFSYVRTHNEGRVNFLYHPIDMCRKSPTS